jgi:hypothetical protein
MIKPDGPPLPTVVIESGWSESRIVERRYEPVANRRRRLLSCCNVDN